MCRVVQDYDSSECVLNVNDWDHNKALLDLPCVSVVVRLGGRAGEQSKYLTPDLPGPLPPWQRDARR